jgi:hypothetical protein
LVHLGSRRSPHFNKFPSNFLPHAPIGASALAGFRRRAIAGASGRVDICLSMIFAETRVSLFGIML